ncbi:MAG TPA: twin-arginine translocation signal domain-containing protein [Candidatus Acidoferrales bacterium]|nr:twin-arginine translocation signal domain-containing protein [Candidatus Acidoferrales bacterium]
MQRRSFLKGAGVVTVAVVGGGVWRAYHQGVFRVGEGPAYEPWKDWRNHSSEGALTLVRAAILAASPHNTQPWLFKVTNSSIELYLDTQRNTGALDPYLREEHIGMGCALENLALAAAVQGYQARVTPVPGKLGPIPSEPTPKPVARVDLTPGRREESELYDAIPRRHTNRSPYLPQKPIPQAFIDAMSRLADGEVDVRIFLFPGEAERKKIVEISAAANSEIYADPEVGRGSGRWIRVNWSEVQRFRDGLSIDVLGLPPTAIAIAKMMPLSTLRWFASRTPKNTYSDLMLSAPLIGIIAVHDRYNQEHCLRAGRLWQRAHLLATARGLAGRPCNEAVEMIDHEKAVGKQGRRAEMFAELLGDASWQPTFLFYMGYPTLTARASPRRPVEKLVL